MNSKQENAVPARNSKNVLLPSVDIFEDENGITLLVDMPGVPKDAVAVRIDGDTLTIEGEIRLPFPEEMHAEYAEISAGAFRRSFTLSAELDPGQSKSVLNDGVLKLHVPKSEVARKRKIEVKVG